jgi:hypothetical protein
VPDAVNTCSLENQQAFVGSFRNLKAEVERPEVGVLRLALVDYSLFRNAVNVGLSPVLASFNNAGKFATISGKSSDQKHLYLVVRGLLHGCELLIQIV